MTATASFPEPLEIPPLVQGLLYELDPKGPREILLARQATWAAAHLQNMMGDSPAEPDAKWLRLFSIADRIFHRNLRDLDRLQARRPAHSPPLPSPIPAPVAEPDASPTTTSPPSPRPSTSILRPDRRRSHPPRPHRPPAHHGDSPIPLPTADVPFSITPSLSAHQADPFSPES